MIQKEDQFEKSRRQTLIKEWAVISVGLCISIGAIIYLICVPQTPDGFIFYVLIVGVPMTAFSIIFCRIHSEPEP